MRYVPGDDQPKYFFQMWHAIEPYQWKGRQAEVEYYIRRNQVSKYIVIDDDRSLFCNLERLNLYAPNYRTGLVENDIKKILKIRL